MATYRIVNQLTTQLKINTDGQLLTDDTLQATKTTCDFYEKRYFFFISQTKTAVKTFLT